ncbi:MAG TPA: lamin tail domain-containing protein, partial [Terriglobus sp.]
MLALSVHAIAFAAGPNHLVISQLYGGGGNSNPNAVYTNDFVELYNPTASDINLSGYTLQYTSSTGTSFSASNTLALQGTVQSGKYFLIQLAAGNATYAALPTPDFAPGNNVLNLSGTGGKLVLVDGLASITTGCPAATAYVDFVGWGTTANCSYNDSTGVNKAPATTNPTGLTLNSSNTWTGVNSADYSVATPNPRNSGTATAPISSSISDIQANRSTYLGSRITVTGVVTVIKYDGFYVQTPSSTPGSTGDEGIYIFSGANKVPATAVVGNNVTVTGTLTQYPLPTASHTPSLEVTGASLTVNSTGNPLPASIVITAPTATGGINQLRQYESMLVSLPSMTAVGGTDATLVESTETTTSNGQFYVVGTGTPRPFREPG